MATILYFGPARECAGRGSDEISIDGTISGHQLWDRLVEMHPRLADCRRSARLAVDMNYVGDGEMIDDAAEVAIIPPVAGG